MELNQNAPNELEYIREFLNTWKIPNDTREPIDMLQTEEDIKLFMKKYFHEEVPFHTIEELKSFREDIRLTVEGEGSLQKWLEKYPFHVHVKEDMKGITYEPVHEENVYTKVLSIVLMSIQENLWGRLKACPDCRWVFYDHSRNGSKRWCGMYAGETGGRACGTIAKVKNYRAKRKGRSGYNV
ncbi:PadR family transcriptional regulator [Bacillus wiedmannii]|uniref:PadR family transcriptional regulator n=1 Tax=Bacillus wiedmannii TaxID=1890302 RepID=A0A2C3UES9_9BACI|nr:PadR family transcriptional regulator [Bacillus wiedmannii]PHD59642.1 PadR family transcriptional regulator [Bacillus wiedmannii]PRT30256.1 PadR family transcriptional regulator [Bacillus wiedmannii]PRT42177.1 PadR family transcriptional regulator [Bacillus wiedmannii]